MQRGKRSRRYMRAGQIAVDDRIYNRGAAFLLRTQRPDGSWLVRTPFIPISTL